MTEFQGSKAWDHRAHPANRKAFSNSSREEAIADVKRRALTVLRNFVEGGSVGHRELDGPLWALVDVSHGSEAVTAACRWFQVAAAYGDDDDMRQVLCREAYEKIERALRTYL